MPAQLRRAILNRSRTRERASGGFASLDEAVAARCKVADISPAAARLICERQLEVREGRWHWRSDPRLRDLSPMRMSEGQAQALIRAIACPVLFIRGEQGFQGLLAQWQQRRPPLARLKWYRWRESSLPYGKFGQNRRLYRKLLSDPVRIAGFQSCQVCFLPHTSRC